MKLQLDLRVLDCTSQGGLCAHIEAVRGCLAVARGKGVAEPGAEFVSRPQLVLQLGTVRPAFSCHTQHGYTQPIHLPRGCL